MKNQETQDIFLLKTCKKKYFVVFQIGLPVLIKPHFIYVLCNSKFTFKLGLAQQYFLYSYTKQNH